MYTVRHSTCWRTQIVRVKVVEKRKKSNLRKNLRLWPYRFDRCCLLSDTLAVENNLFQTIDRGSEETIPYRLSSHSD